MHDFITKHGGYPSFLHLYGFPGTACISVNDEIIHGIPSKKRYLEEGDIVSIDVGACIGFKGIDPKTKLPVGGYHGDCAGTFPVGKVDEEAQRLIDVTEQSFWEGIKHALPGQADLRYLPGRPDLRGGQRVLRCPGIRRPWRGRQYA